MSVRLDYDDCIQPVAHEGWSGVPRVRGCYYTPPSVECYDCPGSLLTTQAVAPVGGVASMIWVMICPECGTARTYPSTDEPMVDK